MAEDVTLPVDSFREAAPLLRRPFSPAAVHWKIQATTPKENPDRGMVVGYIDARLVAERLNFVIPDKWSTRFEHFGDRVDSGLLVCHLTIDGLTRSDVGANRGTNDPVKGGFSDAFKRAAVHFGVGVSLYAMSRVWLDAGDGDVNGRPTLKKSRKSLSLTAGAEQWLRQMYKRWVEDGDGKVFGDVLDHGDVEDSVGPMMDEDAAPPEQGGEDTLELAAAREAAEQLYEKKAPARSKARKDLPVARFKAQLSGAESVEDVRSLVEKVKGL